MEMVIAIVVGACLGLLLSESRIPRIKIVPSIGADVVALIAMALLLTHTPNPTPVALVFVGATVVSSALYAGVLWKREDLDPTVTYWGWVMRELTHPRYARELYHESRVHDESEVVPEPR